MRLPFRNFLFPSGEFDSSRWGLRSTEQMKGFFWLSGDFCDWPLAVIEEVSKLAPAASFSGMVNAPPSIVDRVKNWNSPPIDPIFDIDQLERQWLARPFEPGRLSAYERRLGANAVNRIIVADRMVGYGFVTGGVIPETPLLRMCRDHEMRLRYVVGLLDFFFGAFENSRPDFVFTVGVAGAIALSLATTCKHLEIPLLRLTPTRIGSRYLVDDSPGGLATPVERIFRQALEHPSLVECHLETARKIIADARSTPEHPEYSQINWQRAQKLLAPIHLAALLWRTITRRPPENLAYPYPFAHLRWELKRFARMHWLSRSPIFKRVEALNGRRYAFFPLHVDPEASTMVLAPLLTNQLAIVEALAKSLPAEFLLAVKEHLPMLGRRPGGFYRQMAAVPKVVLISPAESSFDLIAGAEVTCVITGTAGWEAVVQQRPALCLGPAPYHMLGEGFVRCSDLSRLPEAIQEAFAAPPVSDARLATYIASFLEASFEFPTELLWGDITPKIVEDNAHIAEEIATRIVRLVDAQRSPLPRAPAADVSAFP